MSQYLERFRRQHHLPKEYMATAKAYFDPVVDSLITEQRQKGKTLFVGLNGSQGSGKTTLAAYLETRLSHENLHCLSMSLDDFYLGKSDREDLASSVHPLFATRGVPGTHDIPLLKSTLDKLAQGDTRVEIPRFDKAVDDRMPASHWQKSAEPFDLVIFEGWCWGAEHVDLEALTSPVNDLEAKEDPSLIWREYVNEALLESYEPLYDYMDVWLMLKAPSFECVYKWRLEQEQKLAHKLGISLEDEGHALMSPEQVARFVKYYERISIELLKSLPQKTDVLWELNDRRDIIGYTNHLVEVA